MFSYGFSFRVRLTTFWATLICWVEFLVLLLILLVNSDIKKSLLLFHCLILWSICRFSCCYYLLCLWNDMQYIYIGLMSRVFTNGPGDRGSIPGWVIPKTQKMILDAALLNTQHYKVWIKGKVEQSREGSSILPYSLV